MRREVTLTTYELVLWERHAMAVKDLVSAVNGPQQFAWASRARASTREFAQISFSPVLSRRLSQNLYFFHDFFE